VSIRPQKPAPATPAPGKLPLTELAEMKSRRQPIVMVTAYDAPGGRLADEAGVDLVLVGDSAAMTVLGHDSTVPATMDEMLVLTRAVTRGASRPLVIADMPFGSFQVSDEEAVRNAIRFVKEAGADAVKLEGAGLMLSRVRAIVGAGIPVMGHIGLTPQSATMLGGFKAQGRSAEKAAALLHDARALEAAGCFSLVLEAVPAPVAAHVTRALAIPTIGIGAGAGCDGRCSSGTISSASTTAGRLGSSSATPTSARRSGARSPNTRRTCASGGSPRSSTPTQCPTRNWRSSRQRPQASLNAW
jgi:3-methyl-2-oxobutanoate hydroxymethyltransferase